MESGSLSELLSKAEYITKISSYDRQKLDEYAATKEKIAEKEKSLESEHAELLMLQDETEAKQRPWRSFWLQKQTETSGTTRRRSPPRRDRSPSTRSPSRPGEPDQVHRGRDQAEGRGSEKES